MKLLLDTHVLLWSLFSPEKLTDGAKAMIMDRANTIAVSVASLWEIEIKHRKRPETMPYSSALLEMAIDAAGYDLLPIKGAHIDCLEAFISQEIHNDPFDHLLLATAKVEQMTLLTHDSNIALYKNALIQVC